MHKQIIINQLIGPRILNFRQVNLFLSFVNYHLYPLRRNDYPFSFLKSVFRDKDRAAFGGLYSFAVSIYTITMQLYFRKLSGKGKSPSWIGWIRCRKSSANYSFNWFRMCHFPVFLSQLYLQFASLHLCIIQSFPNTFQLSKEHYQLSLSPLLSVSNFAPILQVSHSFHSHPLCPLLVMRSFLSFVNHFLYLLNL